MIDPVRRRAIAGSGLKIVDLEPLRPEHALDMFAGLADPAGYRFLPGDPPASADALRARYDRQVVGRSPDGAEQWLNWVLRGSDHALVGYTQATIRDRIAQLGYHVFPATWRQGIGTAAVRATLDQLFAMNAADEAHALVDTRNAGSIALMRKLGFRLARTITNADFFKGSKSDEHEFALPLTGWALDR